MKSLRGQRVTVMGLGRFGGGIGVARWLCGQGVKVLVTDQDSAQNLGHSIAKLTGLPIEFRLGEHREEDFTNTDLVVASPAVAPNNEFLGAARKAGVQITTEICFFIERCPATIFGVTGTKGKSTTSAMLARILASRYTVHLGGNIGVSLLESLDTIGKTDLVVLELSSFMLEYLKADQWSPHVAVVTMIGQDHIAWHGSAAAYVEAKRSILRFQRADDYAVINAADPGALALAANSGGAGRVIPYSLPSAPMELKLPGRHNQLNAEGAAAAAKIVGISREQSQEILRDFTGLPHRLQLAHEAAGVRWFDDSIATIPEAAVAALEAFAPKTVIQIVGGKDKGLPAQALCAALIQRAKAVLCIGATGAQLADMLEQSQYQGCAAIYHCGDLRTAVSVARRIAVSGDVVLLSPGYASYDQFVNFEQRGDQFAAIAKES
ncbi:MAG TPA: UDP-N-acetylmuramoyl-L-alanine--D-glutamate ligase [Tepidisphaeraceae bacterium]|nr:UDP-N-acetylmuramoyl-L-alanine--D-glutamate ligase [Tepidisphaeraceae bacterium]